jgi:beta-glucosidase
VSVRQFMVATVILHKLRRLQGDINGWMNVSDPLDDTKTYNASGLVHYFTSARRPQTYTLKQESMMALKGGAIWVGYLMPWDKLAYAIEVGQRYLMENTTLGIPALIQSEGTSSLLSM